ncbi:hypothetical protein NF867_14940 [Solitalea sp. MAHUQ-68]|uniref:DUF4468 domain-containing protein n=1 Tax=Solitalea agri TaxID=2953739 RepID=A0A9X2F4I7_9SPHI|nr:hypothetical protein [Solitalea agri]MCO4294156.1 hypothetical protein [Solitalea agri]
MKKLLFFICFLLPIVVEAQKAPTKTTPKSTVKKTTTTTDSTAKNQTTKKTTAQDSLKKTSAQKASKHVDSLAKKTTKASATKVTDSLSKKAIATKKTAKPADSLKKAAVKKAFAGIDSTKKTAVKKTVIGVDSTKKVAGKGLKKPVDSLNKKSTSLKKTGSLDSLSKKGKLKLSPKQLDSLKKASAKKNIKATDSTKKALAKGEKPQEIKGWFEISGADSTDLKESLLKKNSEEWFSAWFAPLNDRYPTFKTSVADSINQTLGYFNGHGTNAFEDQLPQNKNCKIKMDYKTEVRVKGKVYQYRFYDFKIKSTLSQNGKVISEETITDIDEEKEKNRQTKDQFKAWRIKRVQDEMQLILDSFQSIMLQTPQRLNSFE